MEYGCIAGTGRSVIVYFIFGIKFVGRPEGAFSLSAVSYSPVSLYLHVAMKELGQRTVVNKE